MKSRENPSKSDEQAVLDLAEVFHDREMALRLTAAAGFPASMLPEFSTPLTFWGRVVEQALVGVLPGGVRALFEAASAIYPHNPEFRAWLRSFPDQAPMSERFGIAWSPQSQPTPTRRRGRAIALSVAIITTLGLAGFSGLGARAQSLVDTPEDPLDPDLAGPGGSAKSSSAAPQIEPSTPPPRKQPCPWPSCREQDVSEIMVRPRVGSRIARPGSTKEVPLQEELRDGCWLEDPGFISGRVLDVEGHPLAGASVCAWPEDPRVPASIQRHPICEHTDRKGRYQIEVAPGIFDVVAFGPEYAPVSSHARDQYLLPVKPGQRQKEFHFRLAHGTRKIEGIVLAADEAPLVGARVAALGATQPMTIADTDGRFTLWVAEDADDLEVLAWADGYADDVQLVIDDEPLAFMLERESVLLGNVVDGKGKPVPYARVEAGATADERAWSARADQAGSFEILALPAGAYKPRARLGDALGEYPGVITLSAGQTGRELSIPLDSIDSALLVVDPPKSALEKEKEKEKEKKKPPCESPASDAKARKCLIRKVRACGRGRDGAIEVSAPFIIDSGALLSPSVDVTGNAALDPEVRACAVRRVNAAKFPRRTSPTAFRTMKVTL